MTSAPLVMLVLAVGASSCAPALQMTTPDVVPFSEMQVGLVSGGIYQARSRSSAGAAPFGPRDGAVDGSSALSGAVARVGVGRGTDVGLNVSHEASVDVKVLVARKKFPDGVVAAAVDPLVEYGFGTLEHAGGALPVLVGVRAGAVSLYGSAGPGFAVSDTTPRGFSSAPLDLNGPFVRTSLGIRLAVSKGFALQPEYQRRNWLRESTFVHGGGLGLVWGEMP